MFSRPHFEFRFFFVVAVDGVNFKLHFNIYIESPTQFLIRAHQKSSCGLRQIKYSADLSQVIQPLNIIYLYKAEKYMLLFNLEKEKSYSAIR